MCLIAVAWDAHPRYRLALVANRDEFHARPTAPAGPDPDHPDVHGGRDLQAGGGWLMVSRRRRLAAVTNVRAGRDPGTAARSRGALVRGFAAGDAAAGDYAQGLRPDARAFGRFNLLLWDGGAPVFAGNHPRFATHPVAPGLHAMSNGAFDAAWPKAEAATRALAAWLDAQPATPAGDARPRAPDLAPLFAALADETPAPDALLPDTGVGLALERRLSPAFIRDPVYGTRCSSVVLADAHGVLFAERRFGPRAEVEGESVVRLAWRGA